VFFCPAYRSSPVGAIPTGPTLNGQPDIEGFKADSTGEKPSAPSEPGCLRPAHYYEFRIRGTNKNPP
jgi:hypothetical protein